MTLTSLYESVLREIVSCKVEQGINLLAGMLDALCMQGVSLDEAAAELSLHMLHQVLLEDPIYRHATLHPNDCAALAKIIAGALGDPSLSSTGQRLAAATANLPIARALRQRFEHFERQIGCGWQEGLWLCILGSETLTTLPTLAGRELSNVTFVVGPVDIMRLEAGSTFDLIYAPSLADTINTPALFEMFAQVRPLLAPSGRILFSALLPNHLGTGWRLACLNWQACTHEEADLRACAAEAGFSANIYRDESNCSVWGELRIAPHLNIGEGGK
jgi:hypothetical protein